MKRSEQLNELTKALSSAQGEIKGAAKDANNPHFRSQYADLQSVWDAIRGPLTKNGLMVTQHPSVSFDGEGAVVDVLTLLSHTSDQWVESILSMPLPNPTPQAIGSAITYARRYALQSVVGVAPMDDDGEAAEGRGGAPTNTRAQEQRDNRRDTEARNQAPSEPVSVGNWKDVVSHIGKPKGPMQGKKLGVLPDDLKEYLIKSLREKDPSRLSAPDKRMLAALCIWEGERGVDQRPPEEQPPVAGKPDAEQMIASIKEIMDFNEVPDDVFFQVAHARKWTDAETWQTIPATELARILDNIEAATEHCLTALKASKEGAAE